MLSRAVALPQRGAGRLLPVLDTTLVTVNVDLRRDLRNPPKVNMPATVPPIGSAAPDFTLPTTAGKDITLSGLHGKNVLLAFFPLAFTSTCTEELCDMRDEWDQFVSADTVVVPISVDSTATLREFKRQHAMSAELASDFKRDVARTYGVLLEDRFYATRAYFLIDKAGTIRWEHVEVNPSHKRSNAELLERIRSLAASTPEGSRKDVESSLNA